MHHQENCKYNQDTGETSSKKHADYSSLGRAFLHHNNSVFSQSIFPSNKSAQADYEFEVVLLYCWIYSIQPHFCIVAAAEVPASLGKLQ